jgi:Na+:H+ antiporter, NhaA family
MTKPIKQIINVIENTPIIPASAQLGIRRFLAMESAGGILLMLSAILAIICANTFFADLYDAFLHTKFTIGFGDDVKLSKELILWINDGLMAIFFFLVGMEIKREMVEGELSTLKKALLPFFAAAGGVTAPALIFLFINSGDSTTTQGWAIPTATDIAFALGLLALFGSRVPLSLKVFLTAVAVIDDLGAIVIIALFYTEDISLQSIGVSGTCFVILLLLNLRGVSRMTPYILVGLVMWVAVLKSGVHATIAGVVLGFMIPLSVKNASGESMLKSAEHTLHPWVAYFILPLFAFANAGINFDGMSMSMASDPVPLGIAAGLFFGKQIGIFTVCFTLIKLKLAKLPEDSTWLQFYGVCIMCGIGFTMSLFIGGLAFNSTFLITETKIGVMAGSITSGIVGYIVLSIALKGGGSRSPYDVVKNSR